MSQNLNTMSGLFKEIYADSLTDLFNLSPITFNKKGKITTVSYKKSYNPFLRLVTSPNNIEKSPVDLFEWKD